MIRNYIIRALPFLAIAGVLLAIYVVHAGAKPVPTAEPIAQPAASPYEKYVAGAGIIEPVSEDIAIGVPIGQTIAKVFVVEHDHVKAGDPLMQLNDRTPRQALAVRTAELEVARAKATEAGAELADASNQLQLFENVTVEGAISKDEISRRRFAVATAEARQNTAIAEVRAAEASQHQSEDELDRYTIKVPREIDEAEVLEVNVRPGEFAPAAVTAEPLILIGKTNTMQIRVDIDENDAWRVRDGASAVAFVRGNSDLRVDLTFSRIKPYVVPKRSLTGDSTERVDTRVLQVLYQYDRDKLPRVHVGQQMDVFIEAADAAGGSRGK